MTAIEFFSSAQTFMLLGLIAVMLLFILFHLAGKDQKKK